MFPPVSIRAFRHIDVFAGLRAIILAAKANGPSTRTAGIQNLNPLLRGGIINSKIMLKMIRALHDLPTKLFILILFVTCL